MKHKNRHTALFPDWIMQEWYRWTLHFIVLKECLSTGIETKYLSMLVEWLHQFCLLYPGAQSKQIIQNSEQHIRKMLWVSGLEKTPCFDKPVIKDKNYKFLYKN